jgi:biotin synthase
MSVKFNWMLEELQKLYDLPFFELLSRANQIHATHHKINEIQVCHLISVKTGGCVEDCKYCAQSSRYQTSVKATAMMPYNDVIEDARQAANNGATRVCLGAAWREIKDNKQFEDVLKMIRGISDLGLEVCVTLGMLNKDQALRLKEAGLYAYNHNLDSSESFYKTIITTRTYQDRLDTLDVIEKTGLSVCCGGILGMGETVIDRLQLLQVLCNRSNHPESVPINRLATIPGTPLQDMPVLKVFDMVRIIAIARITMPKTMIRLSAGRLGMTHEEHALCFFAGANSIFAGEKLLTIANRSIDKDDEMFNFFGLQKQKAFANV